MSLPPTLARLIALAVAATIFLGGMALVSIFVAAPFSEWIGEQTRGWPAWATIGSGIAFIVIGQFVARRLIARDQRKADRATR